MGEQWGNIRSWLAFHEPGDCFRGGPVGLRFDVRVVHVTAWSAWPSVWRRISGSTSASLAHRSLRRAESVDRYSRVGARAERQGHRGVDVQRKYAGQWLDHAEAAEAAQADPAGPDTYGVAAGAPGSAPAPIRRLTSAIAAS